MISGVARFPVSAPEATLGGDHVAEGGEDRDVRQESDDRRGLLPIEHEHLGEQDRDEDRALEPVVACEAGPHYADHPDEGEQGGEERGGEFPPTGHGQVLQVLQGSPDEAEARDPGAPEAVEEQDRDALGQLQQRLQDEERDERPGEPGAVDGALVGVVEAAAPVAARCARGQIGATEELPEERNQRIGRIGPVEVALRALSFLGVEIVERDLFEFLDGVDEVLVASVLPRPEDTAHRQVGEHEDDIDDRDGRAIEVVVVVGDEFSELVDEGAEADAAEDGACPLGLASDETEEEKERDQHEDAAPEHVGDVETVAPDRRVVGEFEVEADPEDGEDGGHEEALDPFGRPQVSEEGTGPRLPVHSGAHEEAQGIMNAKLPPLRPELDLFASPDPEQPGYVLRDPYQYSDVIAVVPPVLASVLPFFDGEHTELDLRTHLSRLTGEVDLDGIIQSFVGGLSGAGFLCDPAFERMREAAHEEFANDPERLPAHAGTAYADDPTELAEELDHYFAEVGDDAGFGREAGQGLGSLGGRERDDDRGTGGAGSRPSGLVDATGRPLGPGLAGGLVDLSGAPIRSDSDPNPPRVRAMGSDRTLGGGSSPRPRTPRPGSDRLLGIAAPHVSPDGGWQSYVAAYSDLGPELADRTFVILGTSHYGEPERFGLTRKGYRTPLGYAATDVALVDALARAVPESVRMEDYCHAIEHSIEFQVLFLQHLVAPGVRILPILCGAFQDALHSGRRPESNPQVAAFFDVLGTLAAARGRELFWVLGVDLAHVGARYGDPIDAVAEEGPMEHVRTRDLQRLERVAGGERDAFLGMVQPNQDDLKWCGFSPLYTFLSVVPEARGELWRYEQWNIDEASVVSFAAMGFS